MTNTVVKWLHSTSGRSKRSEIVEHGCFVLEHVATGRFYCNNSATVSKTVDKHLGQLSMGKHPCSLLNVLYAKDSEIRVYEYPLDDEQDRKTLLKELKKEATPSYLYLK